MSKYTLAPAPKYTRAYREGDWLHTSNDARRKRIEMMMAEEAEEKKAKKETLAELVRIQEMARWDGKPHSWTKEDDNKWRSNPKFGAPLPSKK